MTPLLPPWLAIVGLVVLGYLACGYACYRVAETVYEVNNDEPMPYPRRTVVLACLIYWPRILYNAFIKGQ
jgi:hypothetical protein